MSSEKKSLLDLDTAQLEALLASLGAPAYRAKQVQQWIYNKYAASFDEMANLPGELRRRLSDAAKLARKAGVKRLVLTHFWPDHDYSGQVAQAGKVFGTGLEETNTPAEYIV
jgi:hypothetical protein